MPNIKANGIDIEYGTFGDRGSPAMLLIMGLGMQMIFWEDDFCKMLARKGFYVIRFDNRDIGLSTKFESAGTLDMAHVYAEIMKGGDYRPPYSLEDMAADSMGLLDSLGIEKAHICGASMGGMIAQVCAYTYPRRVLSLASIMSSTGDPDLPPPRAEAFTILTARAPKEQSAYMDFSVKVWRVLGSPGFPFNEAKVRRLAGESFDRCSYTRGLLRQIVAILACGNRKKSLGSISVPTLVIHGSDDPLMPIECGRDTSASIPGAKLIIIKGMGHDLPEGAWPEIIEAIAENAQAAETKQDDH